MWRQGVEVAASSRWFVCLTGPIPTALLSAGRSCILPLCSMLCLGVGLCWYAQGLGLFHCLAANQSPAPNIFCCFSVKLCHTFDMNTLTKLFIECTMYGCGSGFVLMYTGFERGGMEIKGHWVTLESWCIIIRVSRITSLGTAQWAVQKKQHLSTFGGKGGHGQEIKIGNRVLLWSTYVHVY